MALPLEWVQPIDDPSELASVSHETTAPGITGLSTFLRKILHRADG
jgi:hypothetical protein